MLTSAMTVVKSRQFKGLSGACVVYVWLAGIKLGGCTGFLEECFAAGVKNVKHFRRQLGGEAEALQTDVSAFDSQCCQLQVSLRKEGDLSRPWWFLLCKSAD